MNKSEKSKLSKEDEIALENLKKLLKKEGKTLEDYQAEMKKSDELLKKLKEGK